MTDSSYILPLYIASGVFGPASAGGALIVLIMMMGVVGWLVISSAQDRHRARIEARQQAVRTEKAMRKLFYDE